ncbi:TfoX/Sxy family protein [Aquibium oceanicum]|uniref:TfoX N-terminal domain-containing protein n=1 Tax=Aquibium oceanicum TaxID=1670800 RepID=A0A1L3SU43_9HYPH|nr:TfoX/Sxy family protein [Aquibium oceanicum]APH72926.1 hypothetical protein BSQ44_17305 [Aquibium oceanicum]
MTDELSERIRSVLADDPNVGEIRMFGGLCFTLNGNMLVGRMKSGDLLARVGVEREPDALAMDGASRMDFTGRGMPGFVVVSADALQDDEVLRSWIAMATAYVGPIPPKVKPAPSAKKKAAKAKTA